MDWGSAAWLAVFPYPHRLEMEVVLTESGLMIATTLNATGDVAVPLSFGFHPYLRIPGLPRAEWQVSLPAMSRLVPDDRAGECPCLGRRLTFGGAGRDLSRGISDRHSTHAGGELSMSHLHIFAGNPSFVDGAAAFIADAAAKAIAERGLFTLALSGGGTPKPIYARLAQADYRQRVPWDRVHIFFGDERCVPPEDARSNDRMAREAWLDQVPIPAEHIHRIRGEDDPAREALRYEQEIAALYRTAAFPAFDLILLGMGDNGHTASLFPGTAALRERQRWVVAQYVEVMQTWRVTFTAPLINAARCVAFLVEGAGKAQMLWNVCKGPYQPDVWPSQLIEPAVGALHWLTDAAAAAQIQTLGER